MSDPLQIAKFAMQGVTEFSGVLGTVNFDGNVYYHFFNQNETSHPEQKDKFLKEFEIEDQPRFLFDKSSITNKILSGEYATINMSEIQVFSRKKFMNGNCDSITKYAIEITNNQSKLETITEEKEGTEEKEEKKIRNKFYAIMTVRIKQKKLKIKINVIVHVYADIETMNLKYNSINNHTYAKQFN